MKTDEMIDYIINNEGCELADGYQGLKRFLDYCCTPQDKKQLLFFLKEDINCDFNNVKEELEEQKDLHKSFEPGDTIVFEPKTFNPAFWKMSIDEKKKYYGDLYDFDNNKPYLFTFLCEHSPQFGHMVIINMDNQKIETMRHIDDFRLATEEEC